MANTVHIWLPLPRVLHHFSTGFLKSTDQPTTNHRPPTNRSFDHRPPTTDHPTNHRPIRNLKTRNSITKLKSITDKDVRLCYECI